MVIQWNMFLIWHQKAKKNIGIMLLPSETFEYGNSHARIGFGRENMKEVLDILEKYINQ